MLSRKVIAGVFFGLWFVFWTLAESLGITSFLATLVRSKMVDPLTFSAGWWAGLIIGFIGGGLLVWYIFEVVLGRYKKKHKPTPRVNKINHADLFKVFEIELIDGELFGDKPVLALHFFAINSSPYPVKIDQADGCTRWEQTDILARPLLEFDHDITRPGEFTAFTTRQQLEEKDAKAFKEYIKKKVRIRITLERLKIYAIAEDETLNESKKFRVKLLSDVSFGDHLSWTSSPAYHWGLRRE